MAAGPAPNDNLLINIMELQDRQYVKLYAQQSCFNLSRRSVAPRMIRNKLSIDYENLTTDFVRRKLNWFVNQNILAPEQGTYVVDAFPLFQNDFFFEVDSNDQLDYDIAVTAFDLSMRGVRFNRLYDSMSENLPARMIPTRRELHILMAELEDEGKISINMHRRRHFIPLADYYVRPI